MEQTYMKEQPILNLLLKMSLPMVVSMLVNSLYNIVDSFFVAKISENAMTALSLGLMPSFPFIWEQQIRKKQIRRQVRECSLEHFMVFS